MISVDYLKKLNKFQNKLGLKFNDISLLVLALTHSSYANENNCESNERLEFLGDAVLELTSSDFLYENFPDFKEGELTKKRAKNVCEPALAKISKKIGIGDVLLLGKGEIKTNGNLKEAPLADAFEALLGAIYLDKGIEETYKILDRYFFSNLFHDDPDIVIDYKSALQEYIQADKKQAIQYEVIKEEGPSHDKTFTTQVKLDNIVLGTGVGKTKKEAERLAAKNAMQILAKIDVSESDKENAK